MRKINPACKFIGMLIPTALLLFFYSPVLNLTVFAVCLVAVIFSGGAKRTLAVAMVPISLSAAALFFTGYYFPSDSHLALNYRLFASGAVWNGLQLSTRVLAFAGPGLLFALTGDSVDMIRSARQQFHLPASFAFGILAAWGIMPGIMAEYRRARAAFRARGLSPAPWSPALLKPLLVKTVRWSEALAMAMESHGFGGGERSEYRVMTLSAADRLFPVLTAALFFAALLADHFITPLL